MDLAETPARQENHLPLLPRRRLPRLQPQGMDAENPVINQMIATQKTIGGILFVPIFESRTIDGRFTCYACTRCYALIGELGTPEGDSCLKGHALWHTPKEAPGGS